MYILSYILCFNFYSFFGKYFFLSLATYKLKFSQRIIFFKNLKRKIINSFIIPKLFSKFNFFKDSISLTKQRKGLSLQLRSLWSSISIFSSNSLVVGVLILRLFSFL